jgi:hypothetical protein
MRSSTSRPILCLSLLGALVVMAPAAAWGNSYIDFRPAAPAGAAAPPTVYQLTGGEGAVTVSIAAYGCVMDEQAAKAGEYLYVRLTITNGGTQALAIVPSTAACTDDQGHRVAGAALFSAKTPLTSAVVAPGGTDTLHLGFALPADAPLASTRAMTVTWVYSYGADSFLAEVPLERVGAPAEPVAPATPALPAAPPTTVAPATPPQTPATPAVVTTGPATVQPPALYPYVGIGYPWGVYTYGGVTYLGWGGYYGYFDYTPWWVWATWPSDSFHRHHHRGDGRNDSIGLLLPRAADTVTVSTGSVFSTHSRTAPTVTAARPAFTAMPELGVPHGAPYTVYSSERSPSSTSSGPSDPAVRKLQPPSRTTVLSTPPSSDTPPRVIWKPASLTPIQRPTDPSVPTVPTPPMLRPSALTPPSPPPSAPPSMPAPSTLITVTPPSGVQPIPPK